MVGHRFNRTFPEWRRWHMRIRVYPGGIQSDTFCSGKQRAHVLSGRSWVFGLQCWSGELRALFACRPVLMLIWETGSGRQLIQEGWSCSFHTSVEPCSASLLQPVSWVLTRLFSRRGAGWKTVNGSSTMGSTAQSTSSDQEHTGLFMGRRCSAHVSWANRGSSRFFTLGALCTEQCGFPLDTAY